MSLRCCQIIEYCFVYSGQIQKELQACEKLRRERRELFDRKTTRYLNTINQLTKDKNIRVKINAHMEALAKKSKENVSDVQAVLRKYQT